jgi:IclR family pca regulon transcriptional regulator
VKPSSAIGAKRVRERRRDDSTRVERAETESVASLKKGLRVITSFDSSARALTLSAVAERAGITRAAARRFLHTLVELEYAKFDGKYFALTAKVLELGFAYLGSLGLPAAVGPALERVSATLGESCSVAVLEGRDIVYVARVAKRRIISIDLGIGARLPAAATSMGRVLLAHLPAQELHAFLSGAPLFAHTRHTVTSKSELASLLSSVREQGYCIVSEELEEGLRSIAVPIVDREGKTVAAMNVGAQSSRVTMETMRRVFLPELRAAAEEVRWHPLLA